MMLCKLLEAHDLIVVRRQKGFSNYVKLNVELENENKPPDNTGKKYVNKITPKLQQKFIDLYTSRYCELSATECVQSVPGMKEAPHIVELKSCLIGGRILTNSVSLMQEWFPIKRFGLLIKKTYNKLSRIQNEARAKGQYGVAARCEN